MQKLGISSFFIFLMVADPGNAQEIAPENGDFSLAGLVSTDMFEDDQLQPCTSCDDCGCGCACSNACSDRLFGLFALTDH
ncbi:MAG: hypothetical protein ABGX16_12405 [Pirellulales bacterium]